MGLSTYIICLCILISIVCGIFAIVYSTNDKYKVEYQKEARNLGISSCVFAVVAFIVLCYISFCEKAV